MSVTRGLRSLAAAAGGGAGFRGAGARRRRRDGGRREVGRDRVARAHAREVAPRGLDLGAAGVVLQQRLKRAARLGLLVGAEVELAELEERPRLEPGALVVADDAEQPADGRGVPL